MCESRKILKPMTRDMDSMDHSAEVISSITFVAHPYLWWSSIPPWIYCVMLTVSLKGMTSGQEIEVFAMTVKLSIFTDPQNSIQPAEFITSTPPS